MQLYEISILDNDYIHIGSCNCVKPNGSFVGFANEGWLSDGSGYCSLQLLNEASCRNLCYSPDFGYALFNSNCWCTSTSSISKWNLCSR